MAEESAVKPNQRASIKRYRKSGQMFGQTFHSGTLPIETPDARARLCALMEVDRWFRGRHAITDRSYRAECIRDAIARLRNLRADLDADMEPPVTYIPPEDRKP